MTSRASDFRHEPVMPEECLSYLKVREDGVYVDCTVGGGGHSSLILSALGAGGRLVGLDKDGDALGAAREKLEAVLREQRVPASFDLVRTDFSRIDEVLAGLCIHRVDGILADLGVSSYQLDEPQRGFGYMRDGPLDMRMDVRSRLTAADVVNTYPRKELERILYEYGEERHAARIVAAICEARTNRPFTGTAELSEVIRRAIPAAARREGPHPAKRTFQAIRIEVNGELEALRTLLRDAPRFLAPCGRMCVLSFHSLEDRLVKEAFRRLEKPCTCPKDLPCVCGEVSRGRPLTRQPIEAGEAEKERNPRSRSAKLRVFEARTEGGGSHV